MLEDWEGSLGVRALQDVGGRGLRERVHVLRGGLMTSILGTFPRRPALALPGLGGVGVGRDAHCSHFPFKPPGPTCDRCWAGRGWGVGASLAPHWLPVSQRGWQHGGCELSAGVDMGELSSSTSLGHRDGCGTKVPSTQKAHRSGVPRLPGFLGG